MITDPVADLLTRIRNASRARHTSVSIPYSKFKEEIVKILSEEGFLGEVKIVRNESFPQIKAYLLPKNTGLELDRVSTPGRRKYLGVEEIRPVKNGFGIGILTTSQGVMTTEKAKEEKLGGEYICEVY